MTAPNLGPSFVVHSAGRVAGASGALTSGVNVSGVVRNGAGDYTVTMGTQIDATQRHVGLTPNAEGSAELVIANDTDGTFDVLTRNTAGAAADVDFGFLVQRTNLPT